MNKRNIVLTALMLGGLACSESSGPEPIPEWANNTSWAGRVTMKSGTELDVALTLIAEVYNGDFKGMIISAKSLTLRNQVSGVALAGVGFGDENDNSLELLFHIPAATPIEGLPVPICAENRVGSIPGAQYVVRASLQQTGEFQGTLNLECYWNPNGGYATQPIVFETQPIILRRL